MWTSFYRYWKTRVRFHLPNLPGMSGTVSPGGKQPLKPVPRPAHWMLNDASALTQTTHHLQVLVSLLYEQRQRFVSIPTVCRADSFRRRILSSVRRACDICGALGNLG